MSIMSKRPRDLHIEHLEDPADYELQNCLKKRRLSTAEDVFSHLQPPERSKADVEDWEDIKELFANAKDKYEAEQAEEAVELFRSVIHESDRLLRLYPDPFLLLSNVTDSGHVIWTTQPDGSSSHPKSSPPSSRDPIRATDPLTTFHYVYGTSMLLLGKILEAYPSLAKDVEPVNSPAFYLAALDVLEDGEKGSHSVSQPQFRREDWRLAVSVGRTLVCLADEKLRRLAPTPSAVPSINFQDDLWPKDSAFGPSFSKRPPLTRRVSLPAMTAHEIMLQATDQFSRAILHMPHPKRHRRQNDPDASMETDVPSALYDEVDPPPTLPGLGSKSCKHLGFVRPRVLYTIAYEVLSIADRMPTASEKESWAKWADEAFMQMELEEQTSENWSYPVALGRGRCWLIIGATRFEAIESLIETGTHDFEGEQAKDARHALLRAIEHLEKARAVQSTGTHLLQEQDPFADVSPMLGEAFVTLATMTPEGPNKEQFFARAAAEGVNIDEAMDDAD